MTDPDILRRTAVEVPRQAVTHDSERIAERDAPAELTEAAHGHDVLERRQA